ncbi:MAG: DUF4260 domain-containing protein [Opitutae bacterium]|nr:DUF4260 domain-containing protein [Opitutae bacterium]
MDTSFARQWLRLEGLAVLAASLLAFRATGFTWGWFVALFLAPDLAMLGYLAGPRAGAWTYNLVHTYALALPLALAGYATGVHVPLGVGVIWCAHIGFDRALGYGLKSPEGFRFTHLGKIGHDKPLRPAEAG